MHPEEADHPPQRIEREGLDLVAILVDDIVSENDKGAGVSESEHSEGSHEEDPPEDTQDAREETIMAAAEQFISEHSLDEDSASYLRQAPTTVISHVMGQGALKGRNLSAMATKRIKVAYSIFDPDHTADPPEPHASDHAEGAVSLKRDTTAEGQPIIDSAQNIRYWNGKLLPVLRHDLNGESVLLPVLCSKLEKFAYKKSEVPDSDTILDWLISDEQRFAVKFDQTTKLAAVKALPSTSWSPTWMKQTWQHTSWKPGQWVWVKDNQRSESSRTWSRSRSPRREWSEHNWW